MFLILLWITASRFIVRMRIIILQASCGVIFSIRLQDVLFTLAKTFACLSIVFRDNFWYFFGMVLYIVSAPRLVKIIMIFMVSHWPQSLWVKLTILRADLAWFYMYVYKLYFLSCTTLYEWLFCSQLIFCKWGLFSCFLAIYRG